MNARVWWLAAWIGLGMGSAGAQVGQTVQPLLDSPALAGAKRNAAGLVTLKDGSSLVIQERGGFLVSARIFVGNAVPSSEGLTVTGGTPAAAGSASGQAAPTSPSSAGQVRAAQLLGAVTGLGDGLATPFLNFLNQPDVARDLAKGVDVNAGGFALKLSAKGKLLQIDVSMNRKADDLFAKATHLLPARRESARPVALRVYSDFQCPYCKQFETQTLPGLLKELPDDVQVEFHQFPLESIHPLARAAAEASECAAQQGKFWEFKDAVFADNVWQQGNPNQGLIKLADQVGLAPALFKDCLAERGGKEAVDAGLQEAARLGLNGTPTVFVNGYQAGNAYDIKGLLQLIQFARAADGPASKP